MIKLKWLHACESAILIEFEGKQIECVDFSSGIFAANLGHWDWNRLTDAAYCNGRLPSLHAYHWDTDIKDEYKRRLLELTGFDEALFFSDGTTAVEAAIRIFRHNTPESYLYAVKDAFHGRSYGPMHTFSRRTVRDLLILNNTMHPRPALIMEGYRGWDAHFWDQDGPEFIHAIDDAPFLIFDEIQSGFYRTGKLFAYQWYPIRKPDLVVIGKGMGNGFPMSGVLVRSKDLLPPDYEDEFSSTHGGNPLAMAFGLAALDGYQNYLTETMNEPYRQIVDLLASRAVGYQHKGFDVCLNGHGMVAAILMPEAKATEVFKECLRRGLMCVHTGKDSLKIGPPLTISDNELERGIGILNESLKSAA